MPETLTAIAGSPDLLPLTSSDGGRCQVSRDSQIDELGILASSILSDPTATNVGSTALMIGREIKASHSPDITLRTKIYRKVLTDSGDLAISTTTPDLSTPNAAELLDFEKQIRKYPTLQAVRYRKLVLEVSDQLTSAQYTVVKKGIKRINFDDPFLQNILDEFRRHIAARNELI